jgi:hypothetical protein
MLTRGHNTIVVDHTGETADVMLRPLGELPPGKMVCFGIYDIQVRSAEPEPPINTDERR